MLTASNITFSYNNRIILNNLSLSIQQGETTALLGLSGSGKTTLFRLLAGLMTPQQGIITHNTPFAYMMQDDLLLPWRTSLENLLLIAEIEPNHRSPSDWKELSQKLIDEVGLTGCENRFPSELSGGMRQRLALARTLLQEKPLLFLDEPFGALDVTTREQMYDLILRYKKQKNLTLLLITHDFHDVIQLCEKAFILRNGKIDSTLVIPPEAKENPNVSGEIELILRSALAGIKEEKCHWQEKVSSLSA